MGQWDQYINQTVNQPNIAGDGVPFLGIGRHAKIAIAEVFVDPTKDKGDAVLIYLVALESEVHAPGTFVKSMFTINANGQEGEYSRIRLTQFVSAACNVHEPQKLGEQLAAMLDVGSARGLLISCDNVASLKDGKPRLTKRGEPVGNATWFHVPGQAPESIASVRQWLDQQHPVRPKRKARAAAPPVAYGQPAYPAAQPQAAPPQVQAPAPPGWVGPGTSAPQVYPGTVQQTTTAPAAGPAWPAPAPGTLPPGWMPPR